MNYGIQVCLNCKWYEQHYVCRNGYYEAIYHGHCSLPSRRKYAAVDAGGVACGFFRRVPQSEREKDAFELVEGLTYEENLILKGYLKGVIASRNRKKGTEETPKLEVVETERRE